jgi:hypothetical protein
VAARFEDEHEDEDDDREPRTANLYKNTQKLFR